MLDVLKDYLQEAATPELCMALESAHNTFDRIGLTNYEGGFEEILMLDDETDFGGTATDILNLTKKLMEQLLRQHDVTVGHDTSLDTMDTLVTAILDIQDYEIKQDILRIVDMDANPKEKLAELVSLVAPVSVEEILLDVEDVGPTLINRIREYVESPNDEAASDEELAQVQAYANRFNAFLNYLHQPKLTITQILTSGLNVGYPFAVYAGLIGRDFEEMQPERAAQELLAIAFVSSDGFQNPRAIIQSNIDQFIADINKITKIDVKIGDYLLGLQR